MEQETEKKRRGRPATSSMKVFPLKADGDLVELLDGMVGTGRNRFINEAIREKAVKEGFLTVNVSNEKDG